jgi:photosystem II stability/assembly factor-like uncharacterized protein
MNPCPVRAFKAVSLSLAFFSIAATSMAAGPRWTPATPFGGSMTALAQSPSAPQTVYAAAHFDQLYASADGGATWQRRAGLLLGQEIADMFVDLEDPLTVYARASNRDLFRTRDGGLHWSPIDADLPSVFALVPDREAPHVLYAATISGLYRSPDGGDSWSLLAFESTRVLTVAIDPNDDATFLAAVGDSVGVETPVVWKSTDHGETWVETSPLPFESSLDAPTIIFDPARPDNVYLFFSLLSSAQPPVSRSTDGGMTWTLLPAATGIRDLLALPNGLLVAAAEFGIARSSDAGDTWSPPLPTTVTSQGPPPDVIERVYSDFTSDTTPSGGLFALGSVGVWRSSDSGTTWRTSNQGLRALTVTSIAAAPAGSETVVAVAGTGVFSSDDHGNTWTRVHSEFSGPQPLTIEAIDPRDSRTVYGFANDGGDADSVLRSTDGGHSWTALPFPYACNGGSVCFVSLPSLVLDPQDPDTVFVAGSYYFHFQGAGDFLVRSDDGGHTWKNLHAVHNLRDLAIAPGRKGTLFGTTCSGLFKSENRGAAWRKAGRGLPNQLCGDLLVKPELAIDPRDPRRIYVGSEHGIFASSDGGETFHAMNKGLAGAAIRTLLIDPSDPTRLYAAVPLRGVFRWKAGLRTWAPLNAGLPVADYLGVLALDPQDPTILYAGTTNQGIFRLDLNE